MRIIIFLALVFSLVFVSCNAVPPMTKGMYISQYESFIENVKANSETYDAKTWEAKNEEYRKYSREYYEQYKSELTEEERNTVMELKLRYFEMKAKKKGKDFLNTIEDAILGD